MDDRLKRTVALLLAGGGLLLVVGVIVMLQVWPSSSYRGDGLNGSFPIDETSFEETGSAAGAFAGALVAGVGGVMVAIGAVAAGVRLAIADR